MIKLNGTELNFKVFPNGETLVDGEQINRSITGFSNHIFFKYENDSDLIKLMFVRKHLDDRLPCTLTIAYMPYSRMDRVEGSSVFTLRHVSEFINSMNFENVTVLEPHSDVTPALLNNCITVFPTGKLLEIALDRYKFDKERDYIFFPDSGAAKRYGKLYNGRQLIGHKERDFQTGYIKRLDIVGEVDTKDFKVIIVDDLSSRGGTFILSANKLKEIGAKEIYLIVTHCENTIFDGDIPNSELIDEVLTTDTILNDSKHKKVYIVKIEGGNF